MTKRTLLRSAVLASGVFLLAGVINGWAAELNFECTTNGVSNNGGGSWHITASEPYPVACKNAVPAGTICTEIDYRITSLPPNNLGADHIAILVDHEYTVDDLDTSRNVFLPCDGDTVTQIGIRDCSRQAVRMNQYDETVGYRLAVIGDAAAQASSIVVKKGKVIEECRIASLGPTTCDPKAQQASRETFTFDDCEIEITLDPCTNKPLSSKVLSGDCAVGQVEIDSLELVINGVAQPVIVGEGWLSSGENSCSTKFTRAGDAYITCSCTTVSDCLVKGKDSCICAGKGVCAGFPDNICYQ